MTPVLASLMAWSKVLCLACVILAREGRDSIPVHPLLRIPCKPPGRDSVLPHSLLGIPCQPGRPLLGIPCQPGRPSIPAHLRHVLDSRKPLYLVCPRKRRECAWRVSDACHPP